MIGFAEPELERRYTQQHAQTHLKTDAWVQAIFFAVTFAFIVRHGALIPSWQLPFHLVMLTFHMGSLLLLVWAVKTYLHYRERIMCFGRIAGAGMVLLATTPLWQDSAVPSSFVFLFNGICGGSSQLLAFQFGYRLPFRLSFPLTLLQLFLSLLFNSTIEAAADSRCSQLIVSTGHFMNGALSVLLPHLGKVSISGRAYLRAWTLFRQVLLYTLLPARFLYQAELKDRKAFVQRLHLDSTSSGKLLISRDDALLTVAGVGLVGAAIGGYSPTMLFHVLWLLL